jgi:type VI secretion system protein ImpA
MLERYWDGIYPLADDGDLEVRAAPLQALLERNASLWVGEVPLSRSPIHSPESDELVPVTYNLWQAIVVAQLEDKKPLAGAMESAMADSPTDFLLNLYGDLLATEEAVQSLKRVLADRFGEAAPGTSAIVDALAKCKSRVRTALAQRGADPEQAPSSEANGHATEEGLAAPGDKHRAAGGAAAGPIRSRDDALARLREVADFFRRTEPHSPIPYLIQRAIHWSRMSFEELLGELVKDEHSRHEISTTLGIRATSGEAASGNGQEESS